MTATTNNDVQDELYGRAAKAVTSHNHDALVEVFNEQIDPHYRPAANPRDSLLVKAIFAENTDAMDMLLAAGAGKRTQAEQNYALTIACDADNETVLRLLLEAGFSSANLPQSTPHHPLMQEYDALPNISLSNEPENLKSRLFRKGANGKAPLDNPKVWHHFDAIAEVLEKQETPITKDELFGINSNGETWLETAIKSHAFDSVQKHLEKQGDGLTLAEIRQEEGMVDLLCRKGNAQSLFSFSMLVPEGGEKALRELQNEVPQDSLWQVRNLSQLRQELRAASPRMTGIGR